MRKKAVLLMILLIFVSAVISKEDIIGSEVRVIVDGRQVLFEGQQPIVVDERTLVPVRGVFEALGFVVQWDEPTQTVHLISGCQTRFISITVGEVEFFSNDILHILDVPAQIIGGRAMVPLRMPLESVGMKLEWDEATNTTYISSENENRFVRDDGVVFETGYFQGWVHDAGEVIWATMSGLSVRIPGVQEPYRLPRNTEWLWEGYRQIINSWLRQTHGFRIAEETVLEWAIYGGPHPSELPHLQNFFRYFVRDNGLLLERTEGTLAIQHPQNQWSFVSISELNAENLSLSSAELAGVGIRLVPYWYYYEHYRNLSPRPLQARDDHLTYISSYGVWIEGIGNFITNYVRPNIHIFGSWRNEENWQHLSQQFAQPTSDLSQLSHMTQYAVQRYFAQDDLRFVMPFNVQFWNKITSRADYIFWIHDPNGMDYGGLYGGGWIGTGISAQHLANDQNYAITLAHEIAHHFGFNEHLAHFFDELLSGGDLRQASGVLAVHYRASLLDWIMFEQAGQIEFMRAIFWGNDTYYRQLWYEHIYPVLGITFENMQLARSATQYAWSWNATSDTSRQFFDGLLDEVSNINFENAFNQNITQDRRNHYADEARAFVNNMANWTRQHSLEPYPILLFSWGESGMPMRIIATPSQ